MRNLAARLAVSLPTVYSAISSKDRLVNDLQRQILDEAEQAVADACAEQTANLRRAVGAAVMWARANPALAGFLLIEDSAIEVQTRALRQESTAFRVCIGHLIASGELPALPPSVAASYTFSLFRGLLWLCHHDSSMTNDAAWIDATAAGLTCGLRELAQSFPSDAWSDRPSAD